MQTTQGTMLQSLRAVQQFIDANSTALAGVVQTGARKRLDDAVLALEGHAADQTGSALTSQGLTAKQSALRTVLLRDHMSPIARIAKADLPNTPEFQPLRMPRGRPTPERLSAAAAGMAQVATQFSDTFVKEGLPQDFVAQLTGAADTFVGSLTERIQTRGRRKGATTGVKAKLSEGRKVVHILDAFVKTALKDDAPLLANWNLVKRVPKTTGRAPATPATPAAPAAPAAPHAPAAPAAASATKAADAPAAS
jgi:hypothetical protein